METPPRSRDGSIHVTDERFNTVSHLFGTCFALVGAALLISQAAARGEPWKIVGVSVYGVSLVSLFVSSTLHHGLVDMIGNVWEWTTTTYAARHIVTRACCAPSAPAAASAIDPTVRKALKGGSHLCAPEYCLRYRPPARSPQSVDTSTTHIGFRCVMDV